MNREKLEAILAYKIGEKTYEGMIEVAPDYEQHTLQPLIIASDVDGVILDVVPLIFDVFRACYPDMKIDYHDYHFGHKDDEWTDKVNLCLDFVVKTDRFSQLSFYPGAVRYFNLTSKIANMYIITYCSEPERRAHNLKPLSYISMVCEKGHKWDMIDKLPEKPDVVFEDKPETIYGLEERGYAVYYPAWQEYLDDLDAGIPVKSWKHLFELMKKLWIKKNLDS